MAIAGVAIAVLASLKVLATFGRYPGIVPDEIIYMRQVFYPELIDYSYGNLLHSNLYAGVMESCGEEWYECAKSVNLAFDALFALFLGLLILLVLGNFGAALFTAGIVFVGPFTMYSSFLMPDTMAAAFVALTLLLVYAFRDRPFYFGVAPGLALGASLMVKPHALTLVVGLALLALFIAIFRKQRLFAFSAMYLGTVAFVGLLLRSLVIILGNSNAPLNPLGSYVSAEDPFQTGAELGAGGLDLVPTLSARLPEALLAGFTNVIPGMMVFSALMLAAIIFTRSSTVDFLRSAVVQLSALFYLSYVLLASAFAVLLELRNAEDVTFRTMTRYWEFSIAFLAIAIIARGVQLLNPDFKNEVDGKPVLSRAEVAIWGSTFLVTSVVLLLNGRYQTISDSSLTPITIGSYTATVIIFWLFIVLSLALSRFGVAALVSTATVLVLALGAGAIGRTVDFSLDRKNGYEEGKYLSKIFERHPTDVERVIAYGSRSANGVIEFISKAPQRVSARSDYYRVIEKAELENNPRWLITGTEVLYSGPYLSATRVSDSMFYELDYPGTIFASEFERYGINSSGARSDVYWGSWMLEDYISFTIPEDLDGQLLIVRALLNEELSDMRVQITTDEDQFVGELEGGQVVTPVTLQAPSGESWSGKTIELRYVGNSDVGSTKKGLGLGFESFSVVN